MRHVLADWWMLQTTATNQVRCLALLSAWQHQQTRWPAVVRRRGPHAKAAAAAQVQGCMRLRWRLLSLSHACGPRGSRPGPWSCRATASVVIDTRRRAAGHGVYHGDRTTRRSKRQQPGWVPHGAAAAFILPRHRWHRRCGRGAGRLGQAGPWATTNTATNSCCRGGTAPKPPQCVLLCL